MPWDAAHPSSVSDTWLPEDEKRENQALFTIGFWPPLISERIKALRAEFTKPGEGIHPVKNPEAFAEASGLSLEWYRTMVKYGLRKWHGVRIEGEPTTLETHVETIDGREHVVVDDDHVDVLHNAGMIVALGMRCWVYNVLSEAQKKDYASLFVSASSKSLTSATSARKNGKAKESRRGSSVKTAKRSKGVRTQS